MKSLAFPIAIFLIAGASAPAYGAQFCVHNSAELNAALATASTNGEDDNIKLAPGIYTPGSDGFQFHSGDGHGLTLGGGFATPPGGIPCSLQLAGAQWSVVDGAGSNRLLDIALTTVSAAPVYLHDLTLRNGSSSGNEGSVFFGGSSQWTGNVFIENVSVRDNHAEYVVAILATYGVILVRSSEFVGNTVTSPYGSVLELVSSLSGSGTTIVFNNSTIANNSVPATSGGAGVSVRVNGNGDVHAANNILWNNGGKDLSVNISTVAAVYLDHNDIGSRYTDGFTVNEIIPFHVDPQFVSATDVHLMSSSPLRDAGAVSPIGGIGGTDLGGGARVVFAGIDLGAYEIQDSIFKDGFE